MWLKCLKLISKNVKRLNLTDCFWGFVHWYLPTQKQTSYSYRYDLSAKTFLSTVSWVPTDLWSFDRIGMVWISFCFWWCRMIYIYININYYYSHSHHPILCNCMCLMIRLERLELKATLACTVKSLRWLTTWITCLSVAEITNRCQQYTWHHHQLSWDCFSIERAKCA